MRPPLSVSQRPTMASLNNSYIEVVFRGPFRFTASPSVALDCENNWFVADTDPATGKWFDKHMEEVTDPAKLRHLNGPVTATVPGPYHHSQLLEDEVNEVVSGNRGDGNGRSISPRSVQSPPPLRPAPQRVVYLPPPPLGAIPGSSLWPRAPVDATAPSPASAHTSSGDTESIAASASLIADASDDATAPSFEGDPAASAGYDRPWDSELDHAGDPTPSEGDLADVFEQDLSGWGPDLSQVSSVHDLDDDAFLSACEYADPSAPSGPYSAAVTHAFGRPNQVTTQPNKTRKNWRPRCRRRGRGRPPESAVMPPQQYAPLQSLCPPQPRNPSPPRRDSGPRVLPLESTSCTVTGVPPHNTTFEGRAWPAPSSTTSSLRSYEVTTRSPAAATDDLSQDGDSDPSAPCTTATRLASPQQYAPLQSLCPPQPRNPSPPRRDSGRAPG